MEIIVVITVMAFLIGTISFALPSKSSRKISTLRIEASKLGFKISSSSIGKNLFKNKELNNMIYKIKNTSNLKEAHFLRDKDELILYSPLKLKYSDDYNEIQNGLQNLSPFVLEIIFSNSSISFIWKENEGLDELIKINNLLKNF
ncbi:hypothetical protein OAW25_01675 [Gammaproteobacteria bacterium]|jgi:hypothetical protein|nr:hypothetical protein [Gammaproteobacteria bacterium]MDC0420329.1 hypothetical protein [Gammaproteobacteria bacterium]MDC3368551.1 hypothetical protein [Gammaproteobacteria bacterium]|tara:strand:- start:256 stop:690 length:435 start_codon:yes stop_codon:yes gene_type:complete